LRRTHPLRAGGSGRLTAIRKIALRL
jgi:hypothetical protein